MWAFLYYLSVSGIAELVDSELKKPDADRRYIPVWPDYDPDSKTFNFFRKAGTIKIWAWLDALLKLAGLGGCTPHSFRASACIWALRCFVEADYVKEGGRWVGTGKSWRKYFKAGSASREKYRAMKQQDPIFRFWIWMFNVEPEYES